MATQAKPTIPTAVTAYRLTVGQFEAMIDAGVFPDRARVELLGGVLVERMTKNNPHNFAVGELADALRRLLPPGFFVAEEKSVTLGRRSRPEPDIGVVRGRRADFRGDRSPAACDLALVVEVSDSSYAKDRGVMWRLYAGAGVPVYWIVNLPEQRVEIFTDPAGRGRSAGYRTLESDGPGDDAPVRLDGHDAGRLAVWGLLP